MLNKMLLPDFNHFFSVEDAGGGEGGNGGGGGGNAPAGDPAPKPDADKGEIKTFTQADVDKAASARAAEAKRKAMSDLAESLGVSVDEAKKIIAASKTAEDAQKTEAQKAKEAADAARAEADAEKAQAAAERMSARIERELFKNHVKDDCLEDSVALLKVDAEASLEEITAAVVAFAERRPEFFGEEGEPKRTPPPGDPKGKPVPKKAEDAFARGEERAKKSQASSGYPILEKAK